MTPDEAVEAAAQNLDVPWHAMQDHEAGAGWDWIVVVPGGENIVGLSETVARRIAADHSASLTASAHTGERMARARHQYDAKLGEITDQDREYAADLMDDLNSDSVSKCSVIAEWFRKVRYEAVMKDRDFPRSTRAPEPMAGAVEGWRNALETIRSLGVLSASETPAPASERAKAYLDRLMGHVRIADRALAASPPPPDGWRDERPLPSPPGEK